MDFIVFMVFALSYAAAAQGNTDFIKAHYTEAHQHLHNAVKRTTHSHLQDFEIVVPSFTDMIGSHISHVIKQRHRRSTDEMEQILSLNGFGTYFRVKLLPHNNLIGENFVVRRSKRDVTTGKIIDDVMDPDMASISCHYRGKMLSHGNKTTSVSLCKGMTGMLRTEDADYLLEPVMDGLNHTFDGDMHPHVLYKKIHLSKENKKMHFCGRKKHYPTLLENMNSMNIQYLSDGEPVFRPSRQSVSGKNVRKRRSISRMSNSGTIVSTETRQVVETMVAADQAMVRNHLADHKDITTYILTVMNMVDGLFSDASLAADIDIVVVEIRILEDTEDLEIDHRADKSLANFCQWQAKENNESSRKHDYAILLTGVDICVDKNAPCDTLGLAQIGGMCSETDSCTINEDMGLGIAFTVAHETGHSFGMRHDGQGNTCSQREGHIMSPTLNGLNGVFTWSPCSRVDLHKFIDGPHAGCLDNEASYLNVGVAPDELPGQMYGSNEQCKWQFGSDAKLCYYRYTENQGDICKALWCQRSNGICETKYMPAAEGTMCGLNKWCRRGSCVALGSEGPKRQNGGWSEFGAWSVCSRTCGGGVTFRERKCNNPLPKHGGLYCEGETKKYQLCNIEKCRAGSTDFRSLQCSEYNTIPYRRQYFTWVPFTKYYKYNFNKCELLCKATGYGFFDMLSPRVKDGTRCDPKSKDVCINGKCVPVGCDNILNSGATVDACGICNGNNATCTFINGSFTDQVLNSGYFEVTRIPSGSRSIKLWEMSCCTHTYIAVKSAADPSRYFLNGDWKVDFTGDMEFAGAIWKYERRVREAEILYTEGPINEDIIIEVLVIRKNPGIAFSYALPSFDNRLPMLRKTIVEVPKVYTWETHVTSCSKSCAGGEQITKVTCLEDGVKIVNESLCDESVRPESIVQACNTQPCPANWANGDWGQCSRSCGGGLQTRLVSCKQLTSTGLKYVSASKCGSVERPPRNQMCGRTECPPEWITGAWSKCSKSCGRGERTRSVRCQSGLRALTKSKCKRNGRKPRSKQSCLLSRCKKEYQWYITAWGQCSKTCGKGSQNRRLRCSFKARTGEYKLVSNKRCRRVTKPTVLLRMKCSNVAKCNGVSTRKMFHNDEPKAVKSTKLDVESSTKISTVFPYIGSRWVAATWQPCSQTCGGGSQVRVVKCVARGNGKNSTSCPFNRKPVTTRSCNVAICPSLNKTELSECVDKHRWCYLVPHHNTCSHDYFGSQCCKSCSKPI